MRGIREESAAQAAYDNAVKRWSRADDAWQMVTWVVVRDPLLGRPVTESGQTRAFTFDGARSIDMPDVTLLYQVTDMLVVIHDALFKDSTHGQAGHA